MNIYKDGACINCDDQQLDVMKKAGWSLSDDKKVAEQKTEAKPVVKPVAKPASVSTTKAEK